MAIGNIGSIIDSLTFGESYGSSNLVHINGDVYVGCYSEGSGNNGRVFTVTIDTNGRIGAAVIDELEYDANIAAYSQIVRIKETNYFIITYQGTGTDGYMVTIHISDNGTITSIDSWEFDPNTCHGMCKVQHVNGTIYMIAYSGTDSDLFVKTFGVSDVGVIDDITGMIDTLEIGGSDEPNWQPGVVRHYDSGSSVVFAIAFTDDEASTDGYVSTVSMTYAGGSITEVTSLEFDNIHGLYIAMCKARMDDDDTIYAISYSGLDDDHYIASVHITEDGSTITFLNKFEADTDYGIFNDIQQVSEGVVADVSVSDESSINCTLRTYSIALNGSIAVLDTEEFESTYGSQPFLNEIVGSPGVFAIFYIGGSPVVNTIKTYNIEKRSLFFGYDAEDDDGYGALKNYRRGMAVAPEFSGKLISIFARIAHYNQVVPTVAAVWKESDKTLVAYSSPVSISHGNGVAWVEFVLNSEAIVAGTKYILTLQSENIGGVSELQYRTVTGAEYYWHTITYVEVPASPWVGWTLNTALNRQFEVYATYKHVDSNLSMVVATLGSAPQNLTVDAGEGGVTVSMGAATLASSAPSLALSLGEKTISMSVATLASSANALTVVPVTIISMGVATLASSASSLVLSLGAVTLQINASTLASGAQLLGVSPGSVALLVDALTIASNAEALTVVLGTGPQTISMNPAALTMFAETLIVEPGAISLTMDALTLISSAEALTLYSAVTISMSVATSALSAEPLALSAGAVSLSMGAISIISSAEVLTVSVAGAPQILNMSAATLASDVPTFIMQTTTTLLMDAINIIASTPAFVMIPGATIVAVQSASITATLVNLYVVGGTLMLPEGRKIIVAPEDRLFYILNEDRILIVKD